MQKIWVIAGPTAAGKTKTAVCIAKKTDTDIISMDSMQIYSQLFIGTARPTIEEMEGVHHDLLGNIPLEDSKYSVARYREDALTCMQKIYEKGKTPLFVGGTGLYLDSILYPMTYAQAGEDPSIREKWIAFSREKGLEQLHFALEQVDPVSAKRIHPHDEKRVIRALEVYESTGKLFSEQNKQERTLQFDARIVILTMDREILYDRINQRVDRMFKAGLLKEVQFLYDMGFDESTRGMQGIGYKEVLRYLKNEISYQEMVECIKQESRRYAKRQLTWFSRYKDALWIDVTETSFDESCEQVLTFFNK